MDTSPVGIGALRGVDSRNAEACALAFRDLKELEPGVVALSLRTALAAVVRDAAHAPRVDVVWTGPDAGGPLVRPTAAVLEEMLKATRSGGEVLLVGYSLTAGDGSPMQGVVELLCAAAAKFAQITVVLHKDDEEANREHLLAAWDVKVIKPRIYAWEPHPGNAGPYTKMHAKALVIDRIDVLVTSANFTYHGLQHNIELGLRVRGPQAAAIAQRFDHLIADKVLQRWE